MLDSLDRDYLKKLYDNSSDVGWYSLISKAQTTLNLIKVQCGAAARNHCNDIKLNLKEEYIKLTPEYFSPDEFSKYKAHITIGLDNLKLSSDITDDVLHVSWY